MRSLRRWSWVAAAAAALAAGCGGNIEGDPDAAVDAEADGGASTDEDGGADAGTDGGADAGRPDGGGPDAGRPDGGTPDAGRPDAGAPDAGQPDAGQPDAGVPELCPGSGVDVLAWRDGGFFTPTAAQPMLTIGLGGRGTCYEKVDLCVDVVAGDYQPHRPDPSNREEHILFNFFRNHSRSWGRYLMGAAAVTFTSKAPHFRMFGRVAIEDRGNQTDTTYTSASARFNWVKGTRYRLCCTLDGRTLSQRCTLAVGGQVVATRQLWVTYLDAPLHLSTGFYVELGAPVNANGIETSPMGWAFSDLGVWATR